MSLCDEAKIEIKKKRKELIAMFADPQIYLPVKEPFTIFMAGSPGAGKTEFSKKFDPTAFDFNSNVPIVRIDADEIRKILSQFDGSNSEVVQPAATIGMDKLFDQINDYDQNAIVDTIFSDYYKVHKNIERSLKHNRRIGIFYIHLDPRVAWAYTKIREKKEGRSVTKEFFIESYFSAKECVDKIKTEFPQIKVYLIEKVLTGNEANPIKFNIEYNILRIDNHLKLAYNKNELELLIK